jgi:hypothetical protein
MSIVLMCSEKERMFPGPSDGVCGWIVRSERGVSCEIHIPVERDVECSKRFPHVVHKIGVDAVDNGVRAVDCVLFGVL